MLGLLLSIITLSPKPQSVQMAACSIYYMWLLERCTFKTVFFNPRQDQDFCLLHPEDPLFQTFSGETLRYKGDEALYPFFINECAYYEKGIALSLARKRRVMVPAIRVQTERERQAHMEEEEEEEWGWARLDETDVTVK